VLETVQPDTIAADGCTSVHRGCTTHDEQNYATDEARTKQLPEHFPLLEE